MYLLSRRRRDEQIEQVERVRARLGALRPRHGWLPRVPEAARDFALLGVQAERMDVGRDSAVKHRDDPAGRSIAGGHGGSASGGRVEGGRTGVEASGPPGRHRVAGGTLADRMPLPLRVLAESLPSSVRSGEAGLQGMHAVVIGVVILAGLGVALISSGLGRSDVTPVGAVPSTTTLETGTPVPVSPVDEAPDQTPVEPPGTVVVHVAGKVADPGIVELPSGSRVVDALDAAGGADGGVDLSTLNLARVLVDGEQVAIGIEPVADPGPTAEVADPVVNINTATATELESLPGVGPALAANIIAWRDEHGRFTAIEELQEVSGIGPAKLAAMADRIML